MATYLTVERVAVAAKDLRYRVVSSMKVIDKLLVAMRSKEGSGTSRGAMRGRAEYIRRPLQGWKDVYAFDRRIRLSKEIEVLSQLREGSVKH